jgi:hypothetical protein
MIHVQKWRQKWVDGRDMRFSRQRKLTLQPKINAKNPQQLYKTVKYSLLFWAMNFFFTMWRSVWSADSYFELSHTSYISENNPV